MQQSQILVLSADNNSPVKGVHGVILQCFSNPATCLGTEYYNKNPLIKFKTSRIGNMKTISEFSIYYCLVKFPGI